jgi:hypothetical protein
MRIDDQWRARSRCANSDPHAVEFSPESRRRNERQLFDNLGDNQGGVTPLFRALRADRLIARHAFIGTVAGGVLAVPLAAATSHAGEPYRSGYPNAPWASPMDRGESR